MGIDAEERKRRARERYAADPEKYRAKVRVWRNNLSPDAKEALLAKTRTYLVGWRNAHPGYVAPNTTPERKRQWREGRKLRNPEKVRRQEKAVHLKSVYGVTLTAYDAMQKGQDGLCAICHQPETATIRGRILELSVDHDRSHCPTRKSCGKCVRGLLCSRCNLLIGSAGDDPAVLTAAIAYLQR